jgi:DNA end-binding protein Ku
LRVADESVGVKLYSAVQDRRVHFHLLHAKDSIRLTQRMADPRTGETVEREQAKAGVEVEPGVFVVLTEDEIAQAEPEASRDIEVTRFVAPEKIDLRWYERPYYLGPDEGQSQRYFALAAALERSGLTGIARWTMRKRGYGGALRAHGGHLALIALRHAEEVIAAGEIEAPQGRAIDDRERALARQLVETLSGPFRPQEFRDELRERVLELVKRKRSGKTVKVKRFEPELVEERSLADVLEASLRKAG